MAHQHSVVSSTPSSAEAAAIVGLQKLWALNLRYRSSSQPKLPRTAPSCLIADSPNTVLYLAYASNLSAETFRGARGIQPLSAVNVHVPSLDLTFDLAGIPYNEPCFANTRYRSPDHPKDTDYHKDRWQKGLIGVVYEVTPADYRTIIASEGGGAGYGDIVVSCYPLPEGSKTVNPSPVGASFEAHTLLQPADQDAALFSSTGNRIHRPDPSYAQPSARYLKLITDGAEEHELPEEYLAYLYKLRPYTITSVRQRVGQGLIITVFLPILLALFGLGRATADKDGKIPEWLANVMGVFFRIVWGVYDGFMKRAFGDGERTENEQGGEESCHDRKRWDKGVRLEDGEKTLR